MRGRKTVAALLCLLALAAPALPDSTAGSYTKPGEAALEWTRKVVALGPRRPGTAAHGKAQQLILTALRKTRATVKEVDFTAQTPKGPVAMKNILAKFGGKSGHIVVISGHYDTYHRPGLSFVGANDGGSSTGFLLAFAGLLTERSLEDNVWIVFLDGEESTVQWENDDHTYGSRHLARQWSGDGTAPKIKALLNVDMIGDADLQLSFEQRSTGWLRDLVWETGRRLGYFKVFSNRQPVHIEDDHVAFLDAGIPSVDLIDFNYGLFNRYWHTENDTLDKLSAGSFAAMLHVVSEALNELAKRPVRPPR
jgi:Zn-dependent M28 family amino/carboxypeptidase